MTNGRRFSQPYTL